MSRHNGQTSSKLNPNSDELQLAVLIQHNKTLMHEIHLKLHNINTTMN